MVTIMAAEEETLVPAVKAAFNEVEKRVVRKRILERGLRPDGRSTTGIRPIWCVGHLQQEAAGLFVATPSMTWFGARSVGRYSVQSRKR